MIRRYTAPKPSAGTTVPGPMRLAVFARDAKATGGCIGFGRFPTTCSGALEPDHVRASHGMGMKSVTCPCNLASLCGSCHRWKTEHGRDGRGILLDYLLRFGYSAHEDGHLDGDCGHVDPVFGCPSCETRRVPA